jgi:hypothetical protein
MRLAAAFAIAPFVPCALVLPLVLLAPGHPAPPSSAGVVVFLMLFSPLLAAPATWLIGVPLFLYFRRRRWLGFGHILIGGAVVATVFTLAFAAYALVTSPNFYAWGDGGRIFVHWSPLKKGLAYGFIFIPFGLLIAALFWLIGIWRSPVSSSNA